MDSHQGLASQLSALVVLSIILMGGLAIFPLHVPGPDGGRLGGAKATALQLVNGTTTSSSTFSNFTSSSSTTALPTNSSTSTSSHTTTTVRSTYTNSTTSQTTTSSSTRTATSNSTTTYTLVNSTSSYSSTNSTISQSTNSTTTTSTNSTITRTATNSTTSFTNSTRPTTTTSFINSTATATSTANGTLVQEASAKWDPYTDFYSFLNYGLFNDGGDCYGFSSTAILYFMHYQLGDQTSPYYPESTTSVSALPGQTGYYTDCFGGTCFDFTTSDTLSQSTFPLYVHEVYGQYQLPLGWSNPTNEQAQVLLLEQSINNGVPALLALGPTDGHAVIAWSYERFSNNSLVIGISDPNYGNVPREAYFSDGQFSYVGTASWSTFTVVSPEMLQWAWLDPLQLSQTVTSTILAT